VFHGKTEGLAVEFLHFLTDFGLKMLNFPHGFPKIVLDFLAGFLEFLATVVIEFTEFVRCDDFPVLDRSNGNTVLSLQESEVVLVGFLFQLVEELLPLIPEFLPDFLLLALVILALEGLRNLGLKLIHEIGHIVLEFLTPPGGKSKDAGFVGVIEVVHVDPIGGRRFVLGTIFEKILDGFGSPGPGRAQSEDVIARALDVHPEGDGLGGSFLSDRSLQRCKFLRRLELELLGRTSPLQLIG
jgi:hypothetical protein